MHKLFTLVSLSLSVCLTKQKSIFVLNIYHSILLTYNNVSLVSSNQEIMKHMFLLIFSFSSLSVITRHENKERKSNEIESERR